MHVEVALDVVVCGRRKARRDAAEHEWQRWPQRHLPRRDAGRHHQLAGRRDGRRGAVAGRGRQRERHERTGERCIQRSHPPAATPSRAASLAHAAPPLALSGLEPSRGHEPVPAAREALRAFRSKTRITHISCRTQVERHPCPGRVGTSGRSPVADTTGALPRRPREAYRA